MDGKLKYYCIIILHKLHTKKITIDATKAHILRVLCVPTTHSYKFIFILLCFGGAKFEFGHVKVHL